MKNIEERCLQLNVILQDLIWKWIKQALLHCVVFLELLWIILNLCSFKLCQPCNIFVSGHSAGVRHVLQHLKKTK